MVMLVVSKTNVRSEHVCCDSGSKLKEEDEGEEDGKGDGHTVVFLDGAAAAEECHEEDDAPDDDQENGSVEKLEKMFLKISTDKTTKIGTEMRL